MNMSSDRLGVWLDRAILVLVVAILVRGAFLVLGRRPKVLLPLPVAFPVPAASRVVPRPVVMFRPPRKVPPMQRKAAEGYMREGSRFFNAGSFTAARKAFLTAQALLPTESAPARAVVRVESKLEDENVWAGINEKAARGDLSRAWTDFASASADDLPFFLDYTPPFVRILDEKGEIASEVSLLRTYCKLRPQSFPELRKLESRSFLFAK